MPKDTIDLPTGVEHLSILDEDGELDEDLVPQVPDKDLLALYRTMVLARRFDERMLKLQRQGRIGTFAPVSGQEAAQLGSIYCLTEQDWFVPSFRETAAALWRGAKMETLLLYAKGYEEGSEAPDDARDLPIAIPVSSQILHAVGLAWAEQLKGEDHVALTYFGDGATSEGDFHEGLNWAGVFQVPCVFLCQNNQWAISIPRVKQTRSKTLAQKAIAYDVPAIQVDGNDILAVLAATRQAVERARDGGGPTLIEAVTYRLSVHTTADDPTKYRDDEEVEAWKKRDPLTRFRAYLTEMGIWSETEQERLEDEVAAEIDAAVEAFEELENGDPLDMFDFVLADLPPDVEAQKRAFVEAMAWAGRDDVLAKIDRDRPEVQDLLPDGGGSDGGDAGDGDGTDEGASDGDADDNAAEGGEA